MNRLALATTLGLTAVGCAHSVPSVQRVHDGDAKCALVQAVLSEPVPTQRLAEFAAEGRQVPVSVAVFVRKPAEGVLERFFEGESPDCGDPRFQVVRQLGRQGLVLYLQETSEGFAYDARRSGPDDLSMASAPQGVIRRKASGGWAIASD